MENNNEDKIISSENSDMDNRLKKIKLINDTYRTKQLTKGGSKVGKYSEFIVGKKGLAALLKYELLISIFSGWPGAAGIFLRGIFYRFLFKKIGKGVMFGQNITIRHPNKIVIGDNVVIDDNCMLDAKGRDNKGIEIKNGVFIGRNTILSCKDGDILLNENVNIGFNSDIHSSSKVTIGQNTLIAAYVYFVAGDHVYDSLDKPVSDLHSTSKGIIVGDNCWFGARALIFDGVNIGNDSIIGASAVLNIDIPPYSVAVGIPAKVIKSRLS